MSSNEPRSESQKLLVVVVLVAGVLLLVSGLSRAWL